MDSVRASRVPQRLKLLQLEDGPCGVLPQPSGQRQPVLQMSDVLFVGCCMNADLCFRFNKNEWKDLTCKLNGGDQEAWAKAIAVFERRIRERFLSCIDALIDADTKPDLLASADPPPAKVCIPGFSIVALCCLLIETLQDFREEGSPATKPVGPCTYPKGQCIKPPPGTNEQFRKFLQRPAFDNSFKDTKVANSFLRGIRNGILHEAETRKWVIWRDEPEGKIVDKEDDGFALNRSLFYAAIKQEFDSYLQELRDPGNETLRTRFKQKMDNLEKEA